MNSQYYVDILSVINQKLNISDKFLDVIFQILLSDKENVHAAYFTRLLLLKGIFSTNQIISKYKRMAFDPIYATKNEFFFFAFISQFLYDEDQQFFVEKLQKVSKDHSYSYDFILKLITEKSWDEVNEILNFGDLRVSLFTQLKYDNIEAIIPFTQVPTFSFDNGTFSDFDPIEQIPNYHPSLIEIAALYGSIECFKFFFSNRVKISDKILSFAIQGGNLEIIRILSREPNISFQYAIYDACKFLRNDVFNWLLLSIVDEDTIQYDALLDVALSSENFYVISMCLKHNMTNTMPAVVNAIENNKIDSILYLLQNNIPLEMTYKRVPLLLLAARSSEELFTIFYNLPGCNANAKNLDGETILHILVQKRFYSTLSVVLQNKDIDINAQAKSGETPLHWAAHMKDLKAAKMILSHPNIDPFIEAKNGRTPYDIAKTNRFQELIELLDKYV